MTQTLFIISTLILTSTTLSSQNKTNPKKYVFYLHGMIVENMGLDAYSEQYGKYEYKEILKALGGENIEVISEVRPKNTDVGEYAKKVVGQIEELLANGVPAGDISVVGASKGALIAMQTSTLLGNKDVKFIFIAGAFNFLNDQYDFDLHGNILGFYEKSDTIANFGYRSVIDRSSGVSKFKEIELNTGMGHGIVFKPLKEWVEPAKEWMRI